jgi:hypothetical protein
MSVHIQYFPAGAWVTGNGQVLASPPCPLWPLMSGPCPQERRTRCEFYNNIIKQSGTRTRDLCSYSTNFTTVTSIERELDIIFLPKYPSIRQKIFPLKTVSSKSLLSISTNTARVVLTDVSVERDDLGVRWKLPWLRPLFSRVTTKVGGAKFLSCSSFVSHIGRHLWCRSFPRPTT